MSAKETTYQTIADELGIRFDGIQDWGFKILTAFTILHGPAHGATFYVDREEDVNIPHVRNLVVAKVAGFLRG